MTVGALTLTLMELASVLDGASLWNLVLTAFLKSYATSQIKLSEFFYFQNETPYLFFDSVSRSLEGGSPLSLAYTFPSDAFLASLKGSGSCCRSSTFRVSCINASRLVLRVVEDQA